MLTFSDVLETLATMALPLYKARSLEEQHNTTGNTYGSGCLLND